MFNSEHCTGDAIRMCGPNSPKTVVLKRIQGTPTGLAKPDVPEVRFLQQKHFDELVVLFSTRLAIVLQNVGQS